VSLRFLSSSRRATIPPLQPCGPRRGVCLANPNERGIESGGDRLIALANGIGSSLARVPRTTAAFLEFPQLFGAENSHAYAGLENAAKDRPRDGSLEFSRFATGPGMRSS
jgi:hypothetical protein